MRVRVFTFRIYQVSIDPIFWEVSVGCVDDLGATFCRSQRYAFAGRAVKDYHTLSNAMHRHLVIPVWREVPGHVRDTRRFQFKRLNVAWLRLLWTIADGLSIARFWGIKPRTRADHWG